MSTAAQPDTLVKIPGGFYSEASHTYLNESRVERPSVTQILDSVGLTDLSRVSPETLEHKRKLGDAVHYYAHLVMTDPEVDCWESVHEDCVPYCLAFDEFRSREKFVLDVVEGRPQTEVAGIHKAYGMEYGFTFDLRGRLDGFPVIADIKCTYDEEPSWRYQLAAYAETQPKPEGSPTWGRMVIHLKRDGTYKLVTFNDPGDRNVFLWSLGIVFTKIKHGLPWRKENNNGR